MPIQIDTVCLEDPVVLAPMSGVSDMPFRRLVKRWGTGLVISEMIASQAMIRANRKTMKMATNCAEEYPMAVQLAGCEPALVAEAAEAERGSGRRHHRHQHGLSGEKGHQRPAGRPRR